MQRLPLDFQIPDILEHDIDQLIKAIDKGQLLLDCEESEVISSINMSLMARQITKEQAKWIRCYYVERGYIDELD